MPNSNLSFAHDFLFCIKSCHEEVVGHLIPGEYEALPEAKKYATTSAGGKSCEYETGEYESSAEMASVSHRNQSVTVSS